MRSAFLIGILTCSASVTGAQPAGGFPAVFDPAALDGTNGYVLNGVLAGDDTGMALAGAGDINNDGLNDLLLGAQNADRSGLNNVGVSFVVFGKPYDATATVELSSLNGANGFNIRGQSNGDSFGWDVRCAGDLNGDTIDDAVFGAIAADPFGNQSAGTSYVIFGSNSSFGSSFNLNALNGSNGFAVHGVSAFDQSGRRVSSAGDINNDGVDDLLIAAPSADPSGRSNAGTAYVVFGKTTGFASSVSLASLNGTNGFSIPGETGGDNLGRGAAYAGDVNDDGIDDLILGAPTGEPPGMFNIGETSVIFGSSNTFPASFDLGTLNGSNGLRINGDGGQAGIDVRSAGDFNGDHIDDVIIGAHRNGPGSAYIVFGKDTAFTSPFSVTSINGSNGIELVGLNNGDEAGMAVSSAGDLNNDGFDDVLVGAWFADPDGRSNAGIIYVVFGTDEPLPASLNLSTLDGTNGFIIQGIDADDLLGEDVAGVGDVSGDGIDDILISARRGDPGGRTDAGECYVIFGRATPCLPDANNDGVLDPSDFTAWINAYNNNLPKCDQNGDSLCTPADFTAWINNYNAGC